MKNRRRMWGAWGLAPALALILISAACRSAPTIRYYVLSPPSSAGDPASGEGFHVGVETFAVDPPYDQDRLVYRVGRASGEVGFYNHHRWASPPGRLTSTALVSGLRGTPGIASIEPARAMGSYSLLLTGRIVAMEEIDLPGAELAHLRIDLKLLDPSDDAIVWTRLVTVEKEGRAEEASDVMGQMQAAFELLVAEVRAELADVLAKRAVEGS